MKKVLHLIIIGILLFCICIITTGCQNNRKNSTNIKNTLNDQNEQNSTEIPDKPEKTETSFVQGKEVPKKVSDSIKELFDEYFNYCNSNEYKKAYELLSTDCKKIYYPTIDSFKEYIESIFEGEKNTYEIDCLSIVDNKYIYTVKIMNQTYEYYYSEEYVFTENSKKIEMALGGFIENKKINKTYEDENIKIEIISELVEYELRTYDIKIINKTSNYILIGNDNEKIAVNLLLDEMRIGELELRKPICINPNSSINKQFKFRQYYDSEYDSSAIQFEQINVLNKYNDRDDIQTNLKSSIKNYDIKINVE